MYENDHVLSEELQCLSVKDFPSISTTSSINYNSHLSLTNYKQKQQIIESNWGRYGLDLDLWADNKSSVVQMRENKILLDNKECCGFLSDRLIGIGSSFLTRVPESGSYILSKYIMRKKDLTDISILQYHRYLQYIDIANNNITCLSPLNNLSYLMYLDVSRNKIACLSNFSPPWYLTYVNLSHNSITSMSDLKNCWSIIKLNLSHNFIEYISGLENFKYLQNLDLSYNLIYCIENLDNLTLLQKLNLEGNCITSFKSSILGHGINILPNLQTINLAYNKLSILAFFKDTCNLRFVDLKFNKITDLLELMNLSGSLYEIDLRGNICTKWTNYRNVLITFIPSIKLIDSIKVSATEKITATTLFTSPLDLKAARNVIKLTLLEQLNISKVDTHVQTYDEIGPLLIILTGPSTVKKLALALDVIQASNNKIKYCRWHTTKEAYENDDERNGYIFVNREVFNDMARHGEFLVVLDLLGHNYGFHSHQITQLRYENKIGLTQMNLYSSVEISKRYSNVKRILVLTNNVDVHRTWIKEKFEMYTWIKDSIENLLVVKTAKEHMNNKETEAYILHFIQEILDNVIECLELSAHNSYVKLQSTKAKAADIISESKIMIPNRKNKIISKRNKHIRFNEKKNENYTRNSLNRLSSYEENRRSEGLKVILDEKSNIIIIDDEKLKREIHRRKMLHRRNILKTNSLYDFNYDNLSDSTSSDEMIDIKTKTIGQSEILKNIYVELIIKSRDLYLSYHRDHPGFFTLVLLTDDYTRAYNLLINFIHESDINQLYKKPIYLPEIKRFTQTEIPIALANIVNEIRDNVSMSKLQRKIIP